MFTFPSGLTPVAIIVEEINRLASDASKVLHSTVDRDKWWDGELSVGDFTDANGRTNYYYYQARSTDNVRAYILTTLGAVEIDIENGGRNNIPGPTSLSFKYRLCQLTDHWQPLYKNSIERACHNYEVMKDEKAFRKVVREKYQGLLAGITKWYAESSLDIDKYAPTKGSNEELQYITNNLQHAVGRARLVSQVTFDRARKLGAVKNHERIQSLIAELQNEVRVLIESDIAGNFIYNEG